MELALAILSFSFLSLAAVAYVHQRRAVLLVAGVLFFPATVYATLEIWTPLHPAIPWAVLLATLGVSLSILIVFAIDIIWAPFCLELTYLSFLVWLLCPIPVVFNFAGLFLELCNS
ncbi:MAG: hypothetical protein ACLFWL_11330 [Candidatus Brocadiia bacterium]